MPLMQISMNISQLPKRLVHIDPDGTAMQSGFVKITTFDHPTEEEDIDPLGPAENHVLYHHVRDALYFIKEGGAPVAPGFWPENITDMQNVVISYTPPPVAVVSIAPQSATVTVAASATVTNKINFTPADAASKAATVSSSATGTATATYNAGTQLVTVTGVAAGTATITVTTSNGKTTTFDVTVTA